jgi:hypothetical protein
MKPILLLGVTIVMLDTSAQTMQQKTTNNVLAFKYADGSPIPAAREYASPRAGAGQPLSVEAKGAVAEFLADPGDGLRACMAVRRMENGGRCAFALHCQFGFFGPLDDTVKQIAKFWLGYIRSYVVGDSSRWYDSLTIYLFGPGNNWEADDQYDVSLTDLPFGPADSDQRLAILLKILPFGQISYSEKGNSIYLTLHTLPGYSPTKYLRDYAFCLALCIYDFVRLRDKTRVSVTFVDDIRHKKHTYSSNDGLFDKMIEGLQEAF